jgi:hypothetical protein
MEVLGLGGDDDAELIIGLSLRAHPALSLLGPRGRLPAEGPSKGRFGEERGTRVDRQFEVEDPERNEDTSGMTATVEEREPN